MNVDLTNASSMSITMDRIDLNVQSALMDSDGIQLLMSARNAQLRTACSVLQMLVYVLNVMMIL